MGAAEKTELRKRLKAERAKLRAEQVALSSEQVSRHILACDAYRKAQCIMGYLAFGKELSVDAVLRAALAEGKKVVVQAGIPRFFCGERLTGCALLTAFLFGAAVEPIVDAITPVPGGVGSVTTSVLVGHVVEAAMRKVNA